MKPANEIEAWLTEASGLTPALMSEFMFIGQQEIYSFLDATDAERSKKFTALCGTKIFEKIRDEYSDMLKTDMTRFSAVNETLIEQLKQQIISQKEKIAELEQEVAIAEDILAELEGDALKKQMAQEKATLKVLQSIASLVKQVEQVYAQSQRLEVDRQQNEIAVAEASVKLKEYREQVAKLCKIKNDTLSPEDAVAYYSNCAKQDEAYAELQNALDDALESEQTYRQNLAKIQKQLDTFKREHKNAAPDNFAVYRKKYSDTLAAAQAKQATLQERADLLMSVKSLFEKSEGPEQCPLCQADRLHWNTSLGALSEKIMQLNKKINLLEEEIAELKTVFREVSEQHDCYNSLEQTYNTGQIMLAQAEATVAALQKDLEKFEASYTHVANADITRQELQAYLKQQREQETLLTARKAQIEQANKTQQSLEVEEDQLHTSILDASESLEQYIDIPEDETIDWLLENIVQLQEEQTQKVDLYKKELEKVQCASDDLLQLKGQRKEATRRLADLCERLTKAETQMLGHGEAQKWFESAGKALGWLKKDGLPKMVHVMVLKKLCGYVNEELRWFNGPFRVEVGDDLSFVAYFDEEEIAIPSKALSGGQKVMLALSFWSAVSRVFAKNLGLMCMDEPSSELDAENNARLYQILLHWKKLLQQRGQQLVIITHDSEMSPVFDHTIQL